MFSSRDHLAHKTSSGSLNRLEFLQQLVTEFQTSKEQEAQYQVLANLANFAYDPINYDYMRRLNIIDLFLDMLTEDDETLVKFGIGGLCNLALDKENKEHLLASDGVELITECLSSANEDTLVSAITTLMFLVTPESKPSITAPHVVQIMQQLTGSPNKRLSNTATIFLQDYCTEDQRKNATSLPLKSAAGSTDATDVQDIPLPSGPPPDEVLKT